jgi:hypothetical protein
MDLSGMNLAESSLCDANLTSATLQGTIFDGANLTSACLWETQRADWSIKGVICERIYWDKNATIATEYGPGEFEKLYSEQTIIELHYPNGISTFEINTLPALLHHIASKHPDTNIRLQTIEATGGGTKVTISLGETDETTKTQVESDAAQVLQAQLALRTDEVRRLQFERDVFQNQLNRITDRLLEGTSPQIHFHAPVHNAALPSGNAKVEINQIFNDNTALIQLLEKLLTHRADLNLSPTEDHALTENAETVKAELQKSSPDKSILKRGLDFFATLPKEAIVKGAGKLGEKAAEANWSDLVHQLSQFLHHLG